MLERFKEKLTLVDIIASKIAVKVGSAVEHDELVAAGREGLLDAARRYDPSRGVPFGAYATYRIRGAIIDGIRKSVAVPRRAHERLLAMQASSEISEGEAPFAFRRSETPADVAEAEDHLAEHLSAMATAATLVTLVSSDAEGAALPEEAAPDNPEEAFAHAEFMARVRLVLEELPSEAADVIKRHYLEGERLEDIARDLSVSKSWVSRLLTRTTARLARRLQADA